MNNNKRQIKVIKKCDLASHTAQTAKVMNEKPKMTMAQTVNSWISEFETAKAERQRNDFKTFYGLTEA